MGKTTSHIKVPFVRQGKESSNCGPCTLKMVADYYRVRKPNGKQYSVSALNRMLKVEADYGCEKSDMARVIKRMGLKRQKLTLRTLPKALKQKQPVICLFTDETNEGHYAVITGSKGQKIYFNDSYHGKNFARNKTQFSKRLNSFGNWIWQISPGKNISLNI
jgi:ABC-type bacteriocin/lantibiotic exporter with double-glycine peptidase domain